MKPRIQFALCLSIIISLMITLTPVHAITTDYLSEKIIQPKFSYIYVFQNKFDISSGGKATVEVYLLANGIDQAKIVANLQQYKNGAWQTIKTWSSIRNGASCGLSESRYVVSGYSYRMVSYGYAYIDGDIVESDSYVSDNIFY